MIDLKSVADGSDMIVNGYSFTKENNNKIRVLNLNDPQKAIVLSMNGEVLESSMDDIESGIVCEYFQKNKRFIEE